MPLLRGGLRLSQGARKRAEQAETLAEAERREDHKITSKLGPKGIRDDWLIDAIRLILLDAMDNPCGGLFASEIQSILREKEIHVTTQKISLMIKYQGKGIKIHPVELDTECGEANYLNLYYTYPPLDLNDGDFLINSNLEYYDPKREIPILDKKEGL